MKIILNIQKHQWIQWNHTHINQQWKPVLCWTQQEGYGSERERSVHPFLEWNSLWVGELNVFSAACANPLAAQRERWWVSGYIITCSPPLIKYWTQRLCGGERITLSFIFSKNPIRHLRKTNKYKTKDKTDRHTHLGWASDVSLGLKICSVCGVHRHPSENEDLGNIIILPPIIPSMFLQTHSTLRATLQQHIKPVVSIINNEVTLPCQHRRCSESRTLASPTPSVCTGHVQILISHHWALTLTSLCLSDRWDLKNNKCTGRAGVDNFIDKNWNLFVAIAVCETNETQANALPVWSTTRLKRVLQWCATFFTTSPSPTHPRWA